MTRVFNCHEVLTRKPHTCFGCGREFPKGTYMERQVVQNDREVYTIHLCNTCQDVISENLQDGEIYYEGELLEKTLAKESII